MLKRRIKSMEIKAWKKRVIPTNEFHPSHPRGYRNNNPLNIRFSTMNNWQGIIGRDKEKGGMCVFGQMYQGIRAAFLLLNAYQRKYDKRNIRELITRWAPPQDRNNTEAYIKRVCDYMKCEPDFVPHFGAQVELHDCYRLIRAMAGVENGKDSALYISDSDLWEGYRLAFPNEVSHFLAESDIDKAPEVAPSVNKKYFFNYDIKDGNGRISA